MKLFSLILSFIIVITFFSVYKCQEQSIVFNALSTTSTQTIQPCCGDCSCEDCDDDDEVSDLLVEKNFSQLKLSEMITVLGAIKKLVYGTTLYEPYFDTESLEKILRLLSEKSSSCNLTARLSLQSFLLPLIFNNSVYRQLYNRMKKVVYVKGTDEERIVFKQALNAKSFLNRYRKDSFTWSLIQQYQNKEIDRIVETAVNKFTVRDGVRLLFLMSASIKATELSDKVQEIVQNVAADQDMYASLHDKAIRVCTARRKREEEILLNFLTVE